MHIFLFEKINIITTEDIYIVIINIKIEMGRNTKGGAALNLVARKILATALISVVSSKLATALISVVSRFHHFTTVFISLTSGR